ncbi:MAG: serine/threonine-protein kinase, partial [Candidatus Margulisiibacteriota bacterium]
MQDKFAGRYRVLEQLGKGSSGVVYKAWDEKENLPVAVKVFSETDISKGSTSSTMGTTSQFSDFLKEIKMLSRLNHPNLIKILDAGKQDGAGYLVEEYFEGEDIKKWMGRSHSYDEVVSAIEQIVKALEYVHESDIVHKDIKPTNVLVSKDSKVKVLD